MSFNYGAKAVKAAKKIAKYGADVVLVRVMGEGEYDPVSGGMKPGAEQRHPCKALMSLPGSMYSGVKFMDGSTILAGDKIITMGVPGMPT